MSLAEAPLTKDWRNKSDGELIAYYNQKHIGKFPFQLRSVDRGLQKAFTKRGLDDRIRKLALSYKRGEYPLIFPSR